MKFIVECLAIMVTPGATILAIGWFSSALRDREEQSRASRLEFDQIRRFIFFRG